VDEIPFRSATELVAALRARQVSSRELLDTYLKRVERLDSEINAIVMIDAERALAEADAADRATVRGDADGALHGLPMTIKDSIETAGIRTTAGAPEYADHVPMDDAPAVARLRAAGAIVFGKSNLPAFAGDCQTYNDMFGTTNNPWDTTRTPGGSSGGAAAAIAAGLTGLELGSDWGGSIRIPAHFCGVYALKPSWGIVPLRGHIPPAPGTLTELDVAVLGPLGRSADDLDLALGVLAGADAARAVAWTLQLPGPRAEGVAELRVAVCLDDPYFPIDSEVGDVLGAAVDELARAGAKVVDRAALPELAEGHAVAQSLIQGSIAHSLPDPEFDRLVGVAAAAARDDDSPPARWARNITQRARDLHRVAEHRARLQQQWADVFRTVDVLVCPVTPSTAFPHDHGDVDARTIEVSGRRVPYSDQFAWLQAIGAVRLPAVVAPAGLTRTGLPVGIQIVGPAFEDRTAIHLARTLAGLVGGFTVPPLARLVAP
jgi:amidase